MELIPMFACSCFWPVAIICWIVWSVRLKPRQRWGGLAAILGLMMIPALWFAAIFRDEALAVAAGDGDVESVRRLLAWGGDPNRYQEFETPLCNAVEARQIEAARLLLDAGGNPTGDCEGEYLVNVAAGNMDLRMVELLRSYVR